MNGQSSFETAILKSTNPIRIKSGENININGHHGILVNKSEIKNWKGQLPLDSYPINVDTSPQILIKKPTQKVEQTQNFTIKYLKPPMPQPPGDLIIRQEANKPMPPAPPIIIRQRPPEPCTPLPIIIRV